MHYIILFSLVGPISPHFCSVKEVGFSGVVQNSNFLLLVDMNTPLTYEQESYSLLHLALLSENLDTAKLLLEKGCPVNYRDKKHEHILHKVKLEDFSWIFHK